MSNVPPVININCLTLPEAWERAVLETWWNGVPVPTQYDKPGDPLSKDAIAVISVADPFEEPRIHRAMPGGLYDLEVYRQEVVDGIHDHWIAPEEDKWEYTYHERLASYTVPGLQEPIDQIQYIIDTLCETPHSRRAQAVIWKVWADAGIHDPACLQRCWFRIFDDTLILNTHMRSNDAYKAAFMNMFAFTDLQRHVAEAVSERIGRPVKVGQYTHIVDSFHIYGSYFTEFEGFLQSIQKRTFAERTYCTADVQYLFDEAREQIALKEKR